MKPALKKMEAQIQAWSLEIDHLVGMTQRPGVRAGFDSLTYVDELKALHAIARAKLDELERAWGELAAAFKRPMP